MTNAPQNKNQSSPKIYLWIVDSTGPGERLRLESIEWECPVEAVYEDLSEAPIVGMVEPERRP